MARRKSEDKRNALLAAATEVVAEQGLGAPTARIARQAGVAEGTLFTYFGSKDELLNALYLELKGEMRDALMGAFPRGGSVRERAWHVWNAYVEWGVAHPPRRRALAQLAVSDRITPETRARTEAGFGDLSALIAERVAEGALRDQPFAFTAAILGALADMTMDFVIRYPDQAETYTRAGFEAFWRAVAA
ncbi:TetR/AcrR family transcriptional regulator [Longimicrobium sp.]|uniref:TetR/AcrR family transcriptional regulator n=1 Tax=Longimicrobium sp. TaxID=2029185 RepID=UPI002E3194D6|nr:TetR/AcrR family transcriptional regulator [Longimicrobium sp.]HEX6040326.1 TetR/AcrR family transcriptional regulator [Longimicrobium sp.]